MCPLCVVVHLHNQCCVTIAQIEEAVKDYADEITRPRAQGEEEVRPVQVMLVSDQHGQNIRSLKVYGRTMTTV